MTMDLDKAMVSIFSRGKTFATDIRLSGFPSTIRIALYILQISSAAFAILESGVEIRSKVERRATKAPAVVCCLATYDDARRPIW
jgi:hypothetical protein